MFRFLCLYRTPVKSSELDVSALTSSNSNSNSNNGFIMVDYTQYLKDAHVSFAGNDPRKFSKGDSRSNIG